MAKIRTKYFINLPKIVYSTKHESFYWMNGNNQPIKAKNAEEAKAEALKMGAKHKKDILKEIEGMSIPEEGKNFLRETYPKEIPVHEITKYLFK